MKPVKGLTFTPTKVSAYIQRFGTDAENGVVVTALLEDGTSEVLGTYTAPRNNKSQSEDKFGKNANYTNQFVIELTADQQTKLTTTGIFTLQATIGVGNTKEGGVQVEGAVMMPAYMKNDDQKAIFANAKVNDVLVFNPYTAWDGNAAELSSLLKVDKEAAAEMKSNFSFQVEEITRFVAGELNQEIFDQVFGEGVVKTEEEFRAKVKEVIANQFVADSDYKFLLDIRKMLMEKVGKLEFPDALLKRIMRLNNQDKDEKFVEDNYDKSIEELTWHLIKEQLVKANDIKVEQDDILNMAKETTRAQFAQYGMLSVPEEILDNYAKEMLKKKESIEGLVNRVVETKLASALKTQVTLENKNISAADFNKMFE